MTQSVSLQNSNSMGSINKIGQTNNGRIIYEVKTETGDIVEKLSVAQNDADVFEHTYNQIESSSSKFKKYMEKTTPEKLEKKQRRAKWISTGCGLLGGFIPLFAYQTSKGVVKTLPQILLTLTGTLVGLFGGSLIASKIVTPPGVKEFNQSITTLSKLDIQTYKE